MAYIHNDPQSNCIDVVSGYSNSSRELKEEAVAPDIMLLHEGKELVGVRIRNIFEKNEILGAKGEEYIKAFMERNGVPYLYVGQGPTGVAKSEVLKNDLQAHRPDFLIHLPDLGTLFFDVKCRRKKAFNEKGETCFYLFKNELESLMKLQSSLFIPVWLAFLDSDSMNRNEVRPSINLVCVSQLQDYWTAMKKSLTEREVQSLGVIRLPGALFQVVKDKLEFKIGIQLVSEDLVSRYVGLHKGIIRRIEDEVRGFIRRNPALKTGFARTMLSIQRLPFLLDTDVTAAMVSMIQENIISHESRKPLTLVGE